MTQRRLTLLPTMMTLSLMGGASVFAQPQLQQKPQQQLKVVPPPASNKNLTPPVQIQRPQQVPNHFPIQRRVRGRYPQEAQKVDFKHLIEQLPKVATKKYDQPQIQLALILDVSGSMEGLLNQAREELWKVINLFNEIEYEGVTPEIRVALYTHGMSVAKTGLFLEQRLPLTTDLDQVSEILFSIKTRGSEEFSPSSIYAASHGLEWTAASNDFKAIIIAGNEEFVQGPLSMEEGFEAATRRHLITHTIHCGSPEQGIRDLWKRAAQLGGGQFLNINQDAKQQYIETPYDDQIQEQNRKLNETYIPYGTLGRSGIAKQRAQDVNASKMSKASAIQRSITKSNSYYSNDQWDLVDAVRNQRIDLAKVETALLPEALQSMDTQALTQYVNDKQAQRTLIQTQITELQKKRSAYLKAERNRRAEAGEKRLDSVLIEALRKQALGLGFKWRVTSTVKEKEK